MKTIANGCLIAIIALPIATVAILTLAMPALVEQLILYSMVGVGGVVVLALGAVATVMQSRKEQRNRTFRDGAVPLLHLRHHVWRRDQPWPLALYGMVVGNLQIIDRNMMPGGNVTITPFGELQYAEPPAGWAAQLAYAQSVQQTRHYQAVFPGDAARENIYGRDSAMPRLPARALTPRTERPQLTGPVEEEEVEGTFAPVAVPLIEALAQSTPQRFVLGHNDAGDTLAFDPGTQQNLGIVGATGTGKTTGSGFHLLLLALRFGWHPIILDPKGGTDLRPFATHCEWRPTDADVFGEQIATIRQEHERRHELLIDHQAANIDDLHSRELPHILVFCEEYGTLWEEIEAHKKRNVADAINHDIDTMMRMSRMTGIHFCFVDQFPEKWSPQVFMAAKMRLVYQVAPGQDSFLREFKADALPDRGSFMYRRQTWQSWHVRPELRTLLFDAPVSQYEELIQYKPGVRTNRTAPVGGDTGHRSVNRTPPNDRTPVYDSTDLQKSVWSWRSVNPNGTQSEMRTDFEDQGIHIARGYAHECWHKCSNGAST